MEDKREDSEFEAVEAEFVDENESTPAHQAEVQEGQPLSREEIDKLEDELNEARLKADEYLDGWQRSRADFANYKKRIERDQAQVYQVAVGSILKRYLDVVDDLERALKNRPQEGEGAAWAEGIELVYRKMLALLESEGLKQMDAAGQAFDPNFHEAISQEPSPDHESGQVIEVVKHGYMLGERVIRPALVRVAA